jgi:hypothetical protein
MRMEVDDKERAILLTIGGHEDFYRGPQALSERSEIDLGGSIKQNAVEF